MLKTAIIGGGILGSILYRLLKEDGENVIVIDNRSKSYFPTLILSLLLKGEDIELAKESLKLYRRFRIPLYPFTSYTIGGNIDKSLLDEWQEAGAEINIKYVEWLNSSAITSKNSDWLVNVNKLVTFTPIIKTTAFVKVKSEKEAKVVINGKEESFDRIILTAGPWNSYIINVKLPSKSYYCWALLVYGKNQVYDKVIIYDYELRFYSRPFLGVGFPLWIVGDGKAIPSDPNPKKRIVPPDEQLLLERVKKRLGRVIKLLRRGSYCEATPDMRPVYGRLADNLYFAGGLNGYGAEVGPGIAQLLYKFIKEGYEEKEYMIDRFHGITDFEIQDQEPHELL